MRRTAFECLLLRNLSDRFHDLHNLLPFGVLVLLLRVFRNFSLEGRFLWRGGSPCDDIRHAINTWIRIQDEWRIGGELTVY